MFTNNNKIVLLMLVIISVFLIVGCESLLGFYNDVTLRVTDFDGNIYSKSIDFNVNGEKNRDMNFTTNEGTYVINGLQGEVTISANDSTYIVEPDSFTVTPEDSGNVFTVKAKQVAPIASPSAGQFTETPQTIELNYDDGYTIYYTLNGDDPDISSNEYVEPITLNNPTTIKAVAIDNSDQSNQSNIYSGFFNVPEVVLNEDFENAVVGTSPILYYDLEEFSIVEYPVGSNNHVLRWVGKNDIGIVLDRGVNVSSNTKVVATAEIGISGSGNSNYIKHFMGLTDDTQGYGVCSGSGVGEMITYTNVPWQRSKHDTNNNTPSYTFGDTIPLKLVWENNSVKGYIDGVLVNSIDSIDNSITIDRVFIQSWYQVDQKDVTDLIIDNLKVEVITD